MGTSDSVNDPEVGREDTFGNLIANPEKDSINSPGSFQFTPERRRVFRNGSRVFLQYGTDSRFSDTDTGIDLQPDSGDTLTVNTAERVPYPVGNDIKVSWSVQIPNAPQSSDVVAIGFGEPDVDNFDPSTKSYSGSSADGSFIYVTEDNGLDTVFVAEVRDGTIVDSIDDKRLESAFDALVRHEMEGNWYGVGPSIFTESYTDVAESRKDPQQNRIITSVANDDGKSWLFPQKRVRIQVHQDSANSGLTVEAGSLAAKTIGDRTTNFKSKDHTQVLNVSNTTADTYEVVGAIAIDADQNRIKGRLSDIQISSEPSSSAAADVLIQSVDKSSTNYEEADFSVPDEHSAQNSAIRTTAGNTGEGNSPTGPVADDSGTDSSGATLSNTMTNPGGYQIQRTKLGATKNKDQTQAAGQKERVLNDTDFSLILVDANETGDYDLEVTTRQNA